MTLPQPRRLSIGYILESAEVPILEDVTIYELDGKTGYVDWLLMSIVTADTDSQMTFLNIYCDDKLNFNLSPSNMNDKMFDNRTYPLYLLEHNVDGICKIFLACKFYFTKNLKIGCRNNLNTVPMVAIEAHVVIEAE